LSLFAIQLFLNKKLSQVDHLRSIVSNSCLGAKKSSPAGEGWVSGNINKKESLFLSPHPNLLPEGEEARILKS